MSRNRTGDLPLPGKMPYLWPILDTALGSYLRKWTSRVAQSTISMTYNNSPRFSHWTDRSSHFPEGANSITEHDQEDILRRHAPWIQNSHSSFFITSGFSTIAKQIRNGNFQAVKCLFCLWVNQEAARSATWVMTASVVPHFVPTGGFNLSCRPILTGQLEPCRLVWTFRWRSLSDWDPRGAKVSYL